MATAAEAPEATFPAEEPVKKSNGVRNAIEWLAIIAAALLVAFVIKTFLVQAFYIPSASMVPTLQVGDRILVDKVSYDLHSIHRGDIVVFSRPPADNSSISVLCDTNEHGADAFGQITALKVGTVN